MGTVWNPRPSRRERDLATQALEGEDLVGAVVTSGEVQVLLAWVVVEAPALAHGLEPSGRWPAFKVEELICGAARAGLGMVAT